MFCPICGNKIDPEQKFCESCGSPLNQPAAEESTAPVQNDFSQAPAHSPSYGDMPPQQMPENPAFNTQPQNGFMNNQPADMPSTQGFTPPAADVHPQPVQNYQMPDQPRSVSYSGTMPITNSAPVGGYTSNYPTPAKKSGSMKKFIIIAVIIILLVAIGIAAFFFIRRKIERDFIVSNPTKSTLSSYQKYFDANEADDPFYTMLKSLADSGTVKATVSGEYGSDSSSVPINAVLNFGYDRKQANFYLKADASETYKKLAAMNNSNDASNGNLIYEYNLNPDFMYVNYDIAGKSGKYYIDNKTFRDDITSSVFSPDKNNLFGFADKEAFNNFVDSYEKMMKELEASTKENNDDSDVQKTLENIVKSLEKNGNVTVEDGTAVLTHSTDNKSVSADVITYTFDKKGLKAVVNDLRENLNEYFGKIIENKDQREQMTKSLNDSFDSLTKSFDELNDSAKLVIKIYLDRNDHSVLQNTIELSGATDNAEDKLFVDLQFINSPDRVIALDATVNSNGSTNSVNATLKKTDDGTKITYRLDAKSSADNSSIFASVEYNRSSKEFKISAGTSDQSEPFSYTGKADFSGNKLTFNLPGIVKNDTINLSLDLEISNEAPAKADISNAKNFLKITADEVKQEFGSFGNALSSLGIGSGQNTGNDYPYDDDDNGYDYNDDENSQFSFSSSSASIADATAIDSCAKSYYAGVIAGTITSSDDPANTKLPSRNATTAQRRAAADSCTLHDAMKWNNLESLEEKLTEMAANKEGTIYSIYDSDHTSDVVFIIFPTTTFSELYAQNQSQ